MILSPELILLLATVADSGTTKAHELHAATLHCQVAPLSEELPQSPEPSPQPTPFELENCVACGMG